MSRVEGFYTLRVISIEEGNCTHLYNSLLLMLRKAAIHTLPSLIYVDEGLRKHISFFCLFCERQLYKLLSILSLSLSLFFKRQLHRLFY